MRGTMILAALLIGLTAPAAAAEPERPAAFWKVSDDRLSFELARLSAPRRAAGAEYHETMEFSHEGQGLDSAIRYRSADHAVFATLYVYYPSLAHTGVQAIATDQAIRGSSTPPTARPLGAAVASAAGRPGMALTADYDHYFGGLASKAAFIKAGRWMLKLRVSGPESRSAEVAAVMKALLDGLRFDGEAQPRPATPILAGECAETNRPDAGAVDDRADAAANAMLAAFDPAGQPASARRGDQAPIPARIGRDWCRTVLELGDQRVAVLQATGPDRPGDGLVGDSALLVLYRDSGGVIEVVRLAKEKYLLLDHDIAEVRVLGSYDGLPSLGQIRRFFVDGTPMPIRARVRLKPDGGTEIDLPTPSGKKPKTARAGPAPASQSRIASSR